MKRLLERCSALDVHKKPLSACLRILGAAGEIEELNAEFSTMTSQLLALRDWLKGLGVSHVAMEAGRVLEAGRLRAGGRLRAVAGQ